MGVVVPDALVRIQGTKLAHQGPVPITHWGMSGPGILKLSAWAPASWPSAITPSKPKSIGSDSPTNPKSTALLDAALPGHPEEEGDERVSV